MFRMLRPCKCWVITSATANADGSLNSVIQYTAFGEIRLTQGVTPTKYRYTGQLAQAELGLDYYVARWYDPLTGHFTQADSIIPEPGKSQSFDRYAFVMNNPLRYVDLSGHDVGSAVLMQHGYSREEVLEYSGYRTMGKEELAQVVLSNLNYVNKPNWNDLSDYEPNALTDAGMIEESFNMSDYSAKGSKGVVDIGGTIEDPLLWLVIIVTGVRLAPQLVITVSQYFCSDGNCGNEIEVSYHAVERMTERGVSIDQLQQTLQVEPFEYVHQGISKLGYYDPMTKIFIGVLKGKNIITTVITDVTPKYIENLKKVIP